MIYAIAAEPIEERDPGIARHIRVIDTHTEGEPTRVVIEGGPVLPRVSAAERLELLRREHDGFLSLLVREPRGSEPVVGAWLGEPLDPDAVAQVVFFNNVGYLGMCVHGAMGVARALRHLGLAIPGRNLLETPAGPVSFNNLSSGAIEIENVPSWRHRADLTVDTEPHGRLRGDVAYGGNWFFIVREPSFEIAPERFAELAQLAREVRRKLVQTGITGAGGEEIDHVVFTGPPRRSDADGKGFVLCPGLVWDRSPCGTGTSALVACLAADGELGEGQVWRQEGAVGGIFEATYRRIEKGIVPTLRGRAWITGESTLWVEPDDPFPEGILP